MTSVCLSTGALPAAINRVLQCVTICAPFAQPLPRSTDTLDLLLPLSALETGWRLIASGVLSGRCDRCAQRSGLLAPRVPLAPLVVFCLSFHFGIFVAL